MKGAGVRDSRQHTGDGITDRKTGNRRLQGSWSGGQPKRHGKPRARSGTEEEPDEERIRNGSGTD